MTLKDILVPTCLQMLGALSAWLGKAEESQPGDEGRALMATRLAPDMFPLFTQICFACVQAQEGIFRLRQDAFPQSVELLLNEGRKAGEHPAAIAEARARIAATIRIVEEAASDAPDLDPQTPVAHALPQGMIFDLTAEQYVRDWVLPQFYFHVVTAYAILRAQGVALGKVDYVAHMMPHLRPGSHPAQ